MTGMGQMYHDRMTLILWALMLQSWQEMNRQGEEAFRQGRIAESVKFFDRAIEAEPRLAAHHWQRGISLYYAGRFKDCRKQFELHRTVNPEDVENAVWHYLCVAATDGVDAARKVLIPIRGDERVPMAEVHRMFAGKGTTEEVIARAGQEHAALFYAHLYVGLFHEAAGRKAEASEHMRKAALDFAVGHYMHDVARVHVKLRGATR
jgi:lipoprotein NlpI